MPFLTLNPLWRLSGRCEVAAHLDKVFVKLDTNLIKYFSDKITTRTHIHKL
jgi:hypothetical protein